MRANAWTGLHCKDLAALVGTVIRIEFLKADGQPMYQRPLWLFWSGPTSFSLEALCLMYVLRFGIEHFFRFAKQHLGLLIAQTPTLLAGETWVWVVALAYTQLLLARTLVTAQPRPWDPQGRRDPQQPFDTRASPSRLAGIFAPVGNTRCCSQTQWKSAGTCGGFQTSATYTVPGGL